MTDGERAILAELKEVANDQTIRWRDVMEWSTSEVMCELGEVKYRLPVIGINVAVKERRKANG